MITKKTTDVSDIDFNQGEVVLIDKNSRSSSFSVVHKIRKAAGVKKVGHAGTLDPRATGLLIICTGKETKNIFRYQEAFKVYTGTITLGIKTPSMDSETDPLEIKDYSHVTPEMIESVRKTFLGRIRQLPPMYSALKHKGKALYKYARKGKEVERDPREVEVEEFEITNVNLPDISFRIKCSKGTYIRVIANDFGDKLECGGYLTELRRTAIGKYSVDDALLIGEFESLVQNNRIHQGC